VPKRNEMTNAVHAVLTVAVFGATGGVGRAVVRETLADGHAVRALVRDGKRAADLGSVDIVIGDLADAEAIDRTVAGADAVVWTVGATRNSPDQVTLFTDAAAALVASMERHDVPRLIALSGAGITITGERKPLGGRVMSAAVRLIVRHVVEAKVREYEVFSRSRLDWTLVRPPRVVEGAATGRVTAGDRLTGRRVTQGDLARFMVDQIRDPAYLRRAPFVSSG
jgi:putative NADH-flavin reductase